MLRIEERSQSVWILEYYFRKKTLSFPWFALWVCCFHLNLQCDLLLISIQKGKDTGKYNEVLCSKWLQIVQVSQDYTNRILKKQKQKQTWNDFNTVWSQPIFPFIPVTAFSILYILLKLNYLLFPEHAFCFSISVFLHSLFPLPEMPFLPISLCPNPTYPLRSSSEAISSRKFSLILPVVN